MKMSRVIEDERDDNLNRNDNKYKCRCVDENEASIYAQTQVWVLFSCACVHTCMDVSVSERKLERREKVYVIDSFCKQSISRADVLPVMAGKYLKKET